MEPITGSYHEYPRDIPLATPFGEVRLAVTNGNHVFVDFSRPECPLVVRGQNVWGSLHLWRQPDGTFGPDGSAHGGFLDRFEPRVGFSKPACKTMRDRLFDAIVGGVSEWASANRTLFEAAERGRLEADAQALRKEIARLEAELHERREELATLERRLA